VPPLRSRAQGHGPAAPASWSVALTLRGRKTATDREGVDHARR
jgi:hypothetical protein